MQFDPENNIVKLCARGMELEGEGRNDEALAVFMQAWKQADNHQEQFTAAHYVARHQNSIADKLAWDEKALSLALKIEGDSVKGAFPSLYLNVAKGYEDLEEFDKATQNYELALSYAGFLHDDGYSKMIKGGVENGLARVKGRLEG